MKDIWEKFVSSGSVSLRKRIWGNISKLEVGELQLVEAIKTQKPCISYKQIKNNLVQHGIYLTELRSRLLGKLYEIV